MDIKVEKKDIPLSDRDTPLIVKSLNYGQLYLATKKLHGFHLINLKTGSYVCISEESYNRGFAHFSGSVTLTQ